MSNDIWQRAEPESPCVKICMIHPETRLCVGCHRSIDEISRWGSMSREDRFAVLEALPLRAQNSPKRRGGRRARVEKS